MQSWCWENTNTFTNHRSTALDSVKGFSCRIFKVEVYVNKLNSPLAAVFQQAVLHTENWKANAVQSTANKWQLAYSIDEFRQYTYSIVKRSQVWMGSTLKRFSYTKRKRIVISRICLIMNSKLPPQKRKVYKFCNT